MAQITFKGTPCNTVGALPAKGIAAPDFLLTDGELNDVSLKTYAGKKKIISIVPSLDTSVCATSTKRFNTEAASLENTVILVISVDTPFAQGRFCGAECISTIIPLSAFRSPFGQDFGVKIADGPLKGLLARSIMVLDEHDTVQYTELVPEIAQEPDYDAVLSAVKAL